MLQEQKLLLATLEATVQNVIEELARSKVDGENFEIRTKELSETVEILQEKKNKMEEKATIARANLKLLR